jgi:hypothetical protein
MAKEPDPELAARILPPPLLRALKYLYSEDFADVTLVGGTALAGYYAGHRRSDDLDLFARDQIAYDRMRRRVQTLTDIGVDLRHQHVAPNFSRALANLDQHRFTIDVVLDSNLFQVGEALQADQVYVASMRTLFMCKAATLVSRCSEKDLYDLLWLCSNDEEVGPEELVQLGRKIDAGVEAESILIALTSTRLSKEACAFTLPGGPTAAEVYEQITSFKNTLEESFGSVLEKLPVSPLGRTIRQLQRAARRKT